MPAISNQARPGPPASLPVCLSTAMSPPATFVPCLDPPTNPTLFQQPYPTMLTKILIINTHTGTNLVLYVVKKENVVQFNHTCTYNTRTHIHKYTCTYKYIVQIHIFTYTYIVHCTLYIIHQLNTSYMIYRTIVLGCIKL